MKILFFINPISGGVNKSEVKENIISLCELLLIEFKIHVWEVGEVDVDVLGEFTPDRIVVVGGDGTLNHVVDRFAYLNIPFGFISLGSANGTAKEIGLSTNMMEALSDAVLSNNYMESDILLINDNICIHLAGIGTNAEIVSKFEQEPERGFMSYAKHLFSTIIETKKKDFIIKVDSKAINWRGYMLTFANASKYGSGIIINPGGKINDGVFELCNVKDLSIEALFMMGLSKYSEEVSLSDYIEQISTKSAVVETKEPYLLQIDGEIMGEFSRFVISLKPNYFKFVIP